MLGYYYEIVYKKGKENVVFDALSRKFKEDTSPFALSSPIQDWIKEAKQDWMADPHISQLIQRLQEDPNSPTWYA